MSIIGEKILELFCRGPEAPDYPGGTENYTLQNALDFAKKTIPDFAARVQGKTVLDYGCGPGWQAVAMQELGAKSVIGVDIDPKWLARAERLAEAHGCKHQIRFLQRIPEELLGTFDIALSLNSFEHFLDPAAELQRLREAARPGGSVIVSFAEPWLSNNGSHMGFFTKIPWVNVWFSERTVLKVRSRYRDDGAKRYEDVRGGLNRMTLAKFEAIMRSSEMPVEFLKYYSTRGLPLVDKISLVREFLVSSACCILAKRTSP